MRVVLLHLRSKDACWRRKRPAISRFRRNAILFVRQGFQCETLQYRLFFTDFINKMFHCLQSYKTCVFKHIISTKCILSLCVCHNWISGERYEIVLARQPAAGLTLMHRRPSPEIIRWQRWRRVTCCLYGHNRRAAFEVRDQ